MMRMFRAVLGLKMKQSFWELGLWGDKGGYLHFTLMFFCAIGVQKGYLCTVIVPLVTFISGFVCFFVKLYECFFFLDYILKSLFYNIGKVLNFECWFLYPAFLVQVFTRSNRLAEALGSFRYRILPSANRHNFISFLFAPPFASFSGFIDLAITSRVILNKNWDNIHTCLVPNFKRILLGCLLFILSSFSIGLSYIIFFFFWTQCFLFLFDDEQIGLTYPATLMNSAHTFDKQQA